MKGRSSAGTQIDSKASHAENVSSEMSDSLDPASKIADLKSIEEPKQRWPIDVTDEGMTSDLIWDSANAPPSMTASRDPASNVTLSSFLHSRKQHRQMRWTEAGITIDRINNRQNAVSPSCETREVCTNVTCVTCWQAQKQEHPRVSIVFGISTSVRVPKYHPSDVAGSIKKPPGSIEKGEPSSSSIVAIPAPAKLHPVMIHSDAGRHSDVSAEQRLNAKSPIDVSFEFGAKVTVESERQAMKHLTGRYSTPAEMQTDFNAMHHAKQSASSRASLEFSPKEISSR
jgi:hypothetical protein